MFIKVFFKFLMEYQIRITKVAFIVEVYANGMFPLNWNLNVLDLIQSKRSQKTESKVLENLA